MINLSLEHRIRNNRAGRSFRCRDLFYDLSLCAFREISPLRDMPQLFSQPITVQDQGQTFIMQEFYQIYHLQQF